MTGPRSTFRGVAIELAIVVVGILIALGVDQALERRNERRLETQYLLALRADLDQSLDWLSDVGPAVIERRTRAALSIESVRAGGATSDTLALAYAVLFLTNGPRTGVLSSTVDDLVSTGNLRLLKPNVRRGVVQFRLLGETLRTVENDLAVRAGAAKVVLAGALTPSLASAIGELRWAAGPPWPPFADLPDGSEARALAARSDVPGKLRATEGVDAVLSTLIDDLQEQRLWYAASTAVAEELLEVAMSGPEGDF